MEQSFEEKLIIDSRDVDGYGHCRPSALLGHLQETATQAAETHGFGRKLLLDQYGVFWVLTRIWFRLERPLRWEQELTVRTWHRGGKGAIMYRDFDLLVDGTPVGEAVSAWVLMNHEDGRIEKLSHVPELSANGGGPLCKSIILSKLRMPKELTLAEHRLLRYSDTDINGHVNNTKYADFACDALHVEKRKREEYISEMQIGYLAQCWPGEELSVLTAEDEGRWLVRGEDLGHTPRFDASLTMGRLSSGEG